MIDHNASCSGGAASALADVDDLVARRIVLRRETWDQLVHFAEVLAEARGVEVAPADVAVIALEAGLAEVRRGVAGVAGKQARGPSRVASGRASRAVAGPGAAQAQPGKAPQGKTQQGANEGSGRQPRGPVALTADERAQLEALLASTSSTRGRQRLIGLWLGARRKQVALETFRDLCLELAAYNTANFAQNMKKDGALFAEWRSEAGGRLGWKLTPAGHEEAARLLEGVLVS